MKNVYTRTGDCGETSLYSGERIAKSSARIDVYGTIDEFQAALGLARALVEREEIADTIQGLQRSLVEAMAELSTLNGDKRIKNTDVEELEGVIDRYSDGLQDDFFFQIPGESAGSAALHVARTVARRCERALLSIEDEGDANPCLLAFFNRASDLCYVLALCEG